ncbi:hypothetical protein CKO09_00245 [Chromatium weissei]|nr:hypothetical protein [Chromatium weissei]
MPRNLSDNRFSAVFVIERALLPSHSAVAIVPTIQLQGVAGVKLETHQSVLVDSPILIENAR